VKGLLLERLKRYDDLVFCSHYLIARIVKYSFIKKSNSIMGLISMIAQMVLPGVLGVLAECKYAKDVFPAFYNASSVLPFLPHGYAAVLLVNVVGSGLVMAVLGTRVGQARTAFKEKALKNGDKDAEDRFSYPKLYAEGFSREAKDFNCIQRGHQQAIETYTQFVALSLVAGIKYPLVSTVGGLVWTVARFQWAGGYATGTPSRRYEFLLSRGVWISLLMQMCGAIGSILAIADLI
jgi:glutathione S-transferase